jgi:hypothetical protein
MSAPHTPGVMDSSCPYPRIARTGMQFLSRRSRAIYLLPLLLATACTHTPVAVCSAIVPYTAEQQIQAADELSALPAGSILPRFMTDYGVLRAKLRECQ